ncbi:MAG: adenosylmethionine--8-amino-7-oxononanoate transaminase [Fibrobacteria bacterium]
MPDLIARDLKHVWHPCSQMRDYADFPPLEIVGAQGCHLHLQGGRKLIDAVSSWWCKSLGHGHPRLKAALARQMDRFEHVILANTTNDVIVRLSERLAALAPGLNHVFYSGDGSTAVEVAAKLALHARKIQGGGQSRFLALENGYHGETALTLALGDLGLYSEPYREMLPPVAFLRGLPYVDSAAHPLWADCSPAWPELERQLEANRIGLCAVVIEPILQGAGGMRFYSADFLRRLRAWTKANGVILIADEILTGFGRTGAMLACDHAGITADIVCLSKGLTAGWLPMSATLVSDEIYAMFYAEYGHGRDFLHSNTYAGNPLAAAVALEAMDIYRDEDILGQVRRTGPQLAAALGRVAEATGRLRNVRSLGAVVAAELHGPGTGFQARAGFRVFQEAVGRGALLRTLGDTVYWLLPLNADSGVISELEVITTASIRAVLG